MTAPESRRVLVAGDGALADVFRQTFAREGAVVEHMTESSDLGHQPADVFILILPRGDAPDAESRMISTLERSIQLIRTAAAGMVKRKKGVILVLGGLYGLAGFPGYAASSALEGALIAYLRSFACDLALDHVRCMYLACGAGITAVAEAAAITSGPVERTPMKRAASDAEIVQTALYLTSERASFTTGSVIRVDGGWTSWGLLK